MVREVFIDDSVFGNRPPLPKLMERLDSDTRHNIGILAQSIRAARIRACGISTPDQLRKAFDSRSYTQIGGVHGTIVFGPFSSHLEEEGVRLWERDGTTHTRDTLDRLSSFQRSTFYGRMVEMGERYGGVKGVYISPDVPPEDLQRWLRLERNDAVNAYVKNGETLQIEPTPRA